MRINTKGLICPQPVIMVKKALEEMAEGELIATADNVTAKENISRFAAAGGHSCQVIEHDGEFEIHIIKNTNAEIVTKTEESIVVVVGTDKLGQGDNTLGEVLMKSYTFALTEIKPLPKTMIFLNSGAKLTVEDSPVIENLKKLQEMGVEFITCGTCLDYYNIKDKLAVGTVGNMYSIIEKQFAGGKTIHLG